MEFSKRTAGYISVGVVVLYWVYLLLINDPKKPLPNDFSEFVIRIASSKVIQLLVIYILLKAEREPWSALGFRTANLGKQVLSGVLIGVALFLLFNVGLNSILSGIFPKPESTDNSLLRYFSDRGNLFAWMMIGIFGGGFVEELVRIFSLTRFKKYGGQPGLYFALALSSFVFGIGHLYQGVGSAISVGISGLVLGAIYILRGSALELIIIHALGDVLSILAAFQLAGH